MERSGLHGIERRTDYHGPAAAGEPVQWAFDPAAEGIAEGWKPTDRCGRASHGR